MFSQVFAYIFIQMHEMIHGHGMSWIEMMWKRQCESQSQSHNQSMYLLDDDNVKHDNKEEDTIYSFFLGACEQHVNNHSYDIHMDDGAANAHSGMVEIHTGKASYGGFAPEPNGRHQRKRNASLKPALVSFNVGPGTVTNHRMEADDWIMDTTYFLDE